MGGFKDHFSGHAAHYAAARPGYPEALFEWMAAQAPTRDLAWDAGCGNGQAALALAERFAAVHATDPSENQIAAAAPHPRVRYAVAPAEACSLSDSSVDLICVAQALHWFDHARFFDEAARVLRPGGLLVALSYGLTHVDDAVDAVFMRLYDGALGPYWPPERRLVESGYAELDFPFDPLPPPAVDMRCDWNLDQYLAYLRSWSASQRHLAATGRDAVGEAEADFAAAWGDAQARRAVRWPLAVRAVRKPTAR
jgi:SAM-dependent methyltransferase